MSSDVCGECGDHFVWDSDAGSAVCLSCGTLQDSSQILLDAHIDPAEDDKDRYVLPFQPRSTLKASTGWVLAGQGKQAAIERNKITMRQYTITLASRLGHPALATRTLFLFENAMEKGKFHYGKKARLVAGAALAIALRENRKGETMRDIAYLLDESPIALARVFTSLTPLLGVKLTSVDPGWHLPALQKRLIELRDERPPSLPQNLIKILQSTHLPSTLRTAYLLCEVVSRAGILCNLPSSPTACAIYILALESEYMNSLPHLATLAKAFGIRFGVKEAVVMRRYGIISEECTTWMTSSPWLSHANETAKRNIRGKVGKRARLSRVLKDVIMFREKKWKAKLECIGQIQAPNEEEADIVSSSEINSINQVDLVRRAEASFLHEDEQRPQTSRKIKRRKIHHTNDVATFLLAPADGGTSSLPNKIDLSTSLKIATHMLASDTSSFIDKPPTRLQQLVTERGADDIADEDLFDEGELDSFLRSADEQAILRRTCDWAHDDANSSEDRENGAETDGDRARYDNGNGNGLLWKGTEEHRDANSDDDDDDDFALHERITMTLGDPTSTLDDQVVVVGPWMPCSPANETHFFT